MKSQRLAAAFAAASSLFIAGCATDDSAQQSSRSSNPCLNVPPATGTSLVRKEDCGVRPQQAVAAPAAQSASDTRRN